MNFLTGKIALDRSRAVFAAGNVRVPLPDNPELAGCVGKEVCLGLRPQHIRLDRDRPDTSFCLPSKLFVQELRGDHTVASVTVGDRMFAAICKEDQLYGTDENLYMTWAPEHMYLFLEDTGETLLAEGDCG